MSYRTPTVSNLIDPVIFSGPAGTVASGRFLRLEAVPAPLPLLGGAAALAWSRRLKRRLRAGHACKGRAQYFSNSVAFFWGAD